jgi:arsenate reductase-like glutaredoxin family protein
MLMPGGYESDDEETRGLSQTEFDEHGLDAVLNPRSPAYKARNLGEHPPSKAEAIAMMLDDPNLLRRPLVLAKGKAILGYKPEEYDSLR